MKEILNEYGSAIVTIVIAVIIVVLLGGLTIGNATGIIDIFGNNAEKLADTDVADTQSASVTVLNAQAAETVPELKVKANATVNKAITLNDLFEVTNNVKDVDLSVSEITTTLNDSSTDAASNGLVTLTGNKILTFKSQGEYYLTIDIRTSSRLMTKTFKVKSVVEPKYEFRQINRTWWFCKVDFNDITNSEEVTPIQGYPYTYRREEFSHYDGNSLGGYECTFRYDPDQNVVLMNDTSWGWDSIHWTYDDNWNFRYITRSGYYCDRDYDYRISVNSINKETGICRGCPPGSYTVINQAG